MSKSKLKYSKKILLGILVVVLLFFCYRFISSEIDKANIEKFSDIINDVSKERTDYVFVEINPSLVLAVKDNKVNEVACLNDDCIEIYDAIDIKGKSIDESIDSLYNLSKEKGFDTSNGVKVKISNNVIIENKDYIAVEYIDTTKERELLNEVKNNEEIKNISNGDYYSKLWEELKKDPNYDDVYTCNMNDSKELECYIILETGINKDSDYDSLGTKEELEELFGNSQSKVYNSLKKFNFDVRDNKVYINGIEFGYVPLFTLNSTPYRNALSAKKIDILDTGICDYGYAQYENGICQVNDGVYIIPLEKVNLLNPISAVNNMITHSNGLTEETLKKYEFIYESAQKQKEWEERVLSCIPTIQKKGFTCCDNQGNNCSTCNNKDIDTLTDAMYCRITNVINDAYGTHEEKECMSIGSILEYHCN